MTPLTPLGNKSLKTLLEKGKMLVTSIFSFSHNVFFSIKDKYHFWCLICRLQMLSIWSRPKFRRLGIG